MCELKLKVIIFYLYSGKGYDIGSFPIKLLALKTLSKKNRFKCFRLSNAETHQNPGDLKYAQSDDSWFYKGRRQFESCRRAYFLYKLFSSGQGRETLKTSPLNKCKLLSIVGYWNMVFIRNIFSNNKEICLQACVCACAFSK